MYRFRLTGNYLTFEIQREVAAECALDAYAETGIDATLEEAGWTLTAWPGGEWWTVEVNVGGRWCAVSPHSTQTVATCRHCERTIVLDDHDVWVDPEATGDDKMRRELCDAHDSFPASHEPKEDT